MTRKRLSACLSQHLRVLTAYALSITGSLSQAQDMVQDCVVKALSAKNVPEDETRLKPWLLRVLRNNFLDELRHQKSVRAFQEQGLPDDCSFVWRGELAEINAISVRSAFDELEPLDREIIAMIDVYGLTYKEVAETTGVPMGTVMSRISRARSRLLKKVQGSNVVGFKMMAGE